MKIKELKNLLSEFGDCVKFEETILNTLQGNSNILNSTKEKDKICLKSDEVSERIYNFLKNR